MKDTLKIRSMELDGRIVMPPLGTYKCEEDGTVTEELLAYYAARAKNPLISMIITEHSFITLQGRSQARQLSVSDDKNIDGLRNLTDVIHDGGAKVMCQLNHGGSTAVPEINGMPAVAPSPIAHPTRSSKKDTELPLELTEEQIRQLVRLYAEAAARAKKAGYDAVEIHSAHGYLLNQFYSPLTNQRTDSYGGSLEKRLAIHREVIAAVREAVGSDYPVALRLGGSDYMEGGSTIEDAVYASKVVEQSGIDLIDLSGGMNGYTVPGRNYPGYFRDMSEAVKAAVQIPVLLTGGVKTPEDAEKLLEEGAADLVGVGRELYKNADWGQNSSVE